MVFAKIIDGEIVKYPYSLDNLKNDFPNTSFPAMIDIDTLSAFGVVEVHPTIKPPVDKMTQYAIEVTPSFSNGLWLQTWQVFEYSVEQLQSFRDQKAMQVRIERNSKLTETDWTQLPDSSADKVKWATYRQELRDISKQEGFPFDTVWPIKP